MFWIILCVVAVLAMLSEIQYRWKFRSLNRFPGPLDFPLVGHIAYFYKMEKILPNLYKLINYYGSVVKISVLRQTGLLITDPEMLEFFLSSPKYTMKADQYYHLESWLGKGIFIQPGIESRKYRKLYTPSLHFNIMEDHVAVFNAHSDIFTEILRKDANSNPIDIYPKVGNYTLDIIAETTAGVKSNMQTNANKEFLKAVEFMTPLIIDRSLSFWKTLKCIFHLTPEYKQEQRHKQVLENFSSRAIEDRRKILFKNCKENEDTPSEDQKMKREKIILLDALLRGKIDEKPISSKKIITEMNSFLFAGHDTTAITITLMMYSLAGHKEVQDKIVAELKEIFGDDRHRPVTMQDLTQMLYMDLVIKEVLRIHGVVPLIGRKLTQDVDYKGTTIPKDTILAFFLHGLHHNSDLYENPNEFNPDRFLTANIKPYSFAPFSAGPRICIGQKYAINEVKVTFAKLLRHFEFEAAGLDYKPELLLQMVMRPANGVYVMIKPREF